MSDPYGHGETCDCTECTAWSEGYEAGYGAGTDRPPAKRLIFSLHRLKSVLETRWPALYRHLSTTAGCTVLGIVSGGLPADEADAMLNSLDALCRLSAGAPPDGRKRAMSPQLRVQQALIEAGLITPLPRAAPVPVEKRAEVLLANGWVLVPAGVRIGAQLLDGFYRPQEPYNEQRAYPRHLTQAWQVHLEMRGV